MWAVMGMLSHQIEVSVVTGMVVSHDQLMHLEFEWFVRQPPHGAVAALAWPLQA